MLGTNEESPLGDILGGLVGVSYLGSYLRAIRNTISRGGQQHAPIRQSVLTMKKNAIASLSLSVSNIGKLQFSQVPHNVNLSIGTVNLASSRIDLGIPDRRLALATGKTKGLACLNNPTGRQIVNRIRTNRLGRVCEGLVRVAGKCSQHMPIEHH